MTHAPSGSDLSEGIRSLADAAARGSAHPSAEKIAAYQQRTLDEDSAEALRGHLAICKECTALLLDLEEMQAGPQAEAPHAGDETVWEGVTERIRDERTASRRPRVETRSALALAAALALAVVGLSFWNLDLRRALRHQAEPKANIAIFDLEAVDQGLRDTLPGEDGPLTFPSGADRFVVVLHPSVPGASSFPAYEIRIFDDAGRERYVLPGLEPTEFGNFTVELSRSSLGGEVFRIELRGLENDRATLLGRYVLRLGAGPG